MPQTHTLFLDKALALTSFRRLRQPQARRLVTAQKYQSLLCLRKKGLPEGEVRRYGLDAALQQEGLIIGCFVGITVNRFRMLAPHRLRYRFYLCPWGPDEEDDPLLIL